MQVSFPYPTRFISSMPDLDGLRHSPFVNIDNESFAAPKLNGYWRVNMRLLAHGMQGQLALSSFITAMRYAGTTCVIPICVHHWPNNEHGRPLSGNCAVNEWTDNHTGFVAEPFDGFRLVSNVSHRDSYVDVETPALSRLMPGHFFSLGNDTLYQVLNTNSISETPRRYRVHVAPFIRGDHAAGDLVIVDQIRLRCHMRSGEQIGLDTNLFKTSQLEFVEAFR